MSIKTRATIEDLYKVEGKAELVNGEMSTCRQQDGGPGESVCGLLQACSITKSGLVRYRISG